MGGHLDLSATNMSDPLMEVNKILILCSATDSSVSVFKEINSKIVQKLASMKQHSNQESKRNTSDQILSACATTSMHEMVH